MLEDRYELKARDREARRSAVVLLEGDGDWSVVASNLAPNERHRRTCNRTAWRWQRRSVTQIAGHDVHLNTLEKEDNLVYFI